MQPGDLDQRVTIQAPADTDDGYGGTIPGGWADVATVWAQVRDKGGNEAMEHMRATGRLTYEITIRRRDGITTAHRLVWGGRALNIRKVPPPQRGEYMTITAEDTDA